MNRKNKIRISRLNTRNITIETYEYVKPKRKNMKPFWSWEIYGYYGKLDHMTHDLLKLVVEIPKDKDLTNQIKLLSTAIQEAQQYISEKLKEHQQLVFDKLDKEDQIYLEL